jgi:hypothetical protein
MKCGAIGNCFGKKYGILGNTLGASQHWEPDGKIVWNVYIYMAIN